MTRVDFDLILISISISIDAELEIIDSVGSFLLVFG